MESLTLKSLTNSFCVFGALLTLSEANTLPLLERGASFQELIVQTKIPEQILSAVLDILIAAGLVSNEHTIFKASGDLQKQIQGAQVSRLSSSLKTNYGQVRELIESASKGCVKMGWHHTDEGILQAQGVFSEIIATDYVIASPKFQQLIQKPRINFLDVGAGVGKICLKMCELYANLNAIGLEPEDTPFALAQKNIAATPYKNRIELLKLGVQDLEADNTFDVIWIAHGFIIDEHFIPGLKKLKKALKPDGLLFIAAMLPENGLAHKVQNFFGTLRGAARHKEEVIKRLKEAGFFKITEILKTEHYVVMTAEL